jgi:hypothetical protein
MPGAKWNEVTHDTGCRVVKSQVRAIGHDVPAYRADSVTLAASVRKPGHNIGVSSVDTHARG